MNKEKPLVSIFVPYYNDKQYLSDCINSILKQTYENFELILFNHSSTDGSKNIAHSFNDKRIIHIDAKENLGAGSGYNINISLPYMHGKYLKLLCADDMLKEDGIQSLVNTLENNLDKDIVFADMDYVDANLRPLNTTWSKEINKSDFISDEKQTLLKFFQGYSHIAYPAAMIKMSAIKDIKIDNTLIMLFDVSLWVKLLITGKKITFLEKSVVDYRVSDNQLSSFANIEKASKIGCFELFQLLNVYYEIKDIDIIKYLCPCIYSQLLKKGDEEYIPFVLTYFLASLVCDNHIDYFKDQQSVREIFGCTKLFEFFQDENMRLKIEEKFGFGIKDFRAIYSYMSPKIHSYVPLKQHILNKTARNLSILQLCFCIGRKIVHCVSPFYYIKKLKKKFSKNEHGQYTV